MEGPVCYKVKKKAMRMNRGKKIDRNSEWWQVCECLNQSLWNTYSTYFSPSLWTSVTYMCLCRGDVWLGLLLRLCNVSVWCICLQGFRNRGSQIVRGKVMRMSGDAGEPGYRLLNLQGWCLPLCVFVFVVKEHCSQNDLCTAVIYLPGPSERKPVSGCGGFNRGLSS